MGNLGAFDAVGLGQLVRRRKVSPVELLEHAIRRIDAVNPKLNAVICLLYEQARAEKGVQPEERFPGVPYLLKDLLTDMRGAPFADGSRFVHGHVSQVDSELVRRSRASGLVIAGRTNTSEFGVLTTAEPLLYGPARNPWNPGLTTGGSSGGSAASSA